MSLTGHQAQNTKRWQLLTSVLNFDAIESAVSQINAYCSKRKLLCLKEYPDYFDFSLVGKAVIYGFAIIHYPDELDKTLVGRHIEKFFQLKDLIDPVQQAIGYALAEDTLRSGEKIKLQFTPAFNSLKAKEPSPVTKAMVEDVALIMDSFRSTEFTPYNVDFNISPARAWFLGGADIQMELGPEIWSQFTTLRHSPMTVKKLEQQLAYWLLDYNLETDRTWRGWEHLVFQFTRHQQLIRLNVRDYLMPRNYGLWEDWDNEFDLDYLGSKDSYSAIPGINYRPKDILPG